MKIQNENMKWGKKLEVNKTSDEQKHGNWKWHIQNVKGDDKQLKHLKEARKILGT